MKVIHLKVTARQYAGKALTGWMLVAPDRYTVGASAPTGTLTFNRIQQHHLAVANLQLSPCLLLQFYQPRLRLDANRDYFADTSAFKRKRAS